MNTTDYQRMRVPVLERLALLALAEQRGVSEEEALVAIIRDAVKQATRSTEPESEAESE